MALKSSCRVHRSRRRPRNLPAMRGPAPRAHPPRAVREHRTNRRNEADGAGVRNDSRGCARVNPSRIFILRPVATTLLMVAILIVGAIAYLQLPLSALPEVAYPTMQVQTFYPGASPEVVTSSITAPLEKQFGQLPGMSQMTSISSFGSSLITLQFSLDLSIDIAEQEVQASIKSAGTFLPRDLPPPPIYSKTNPPDAPILTLAITSTTLPLPKVEELA